MVSNVQPVDIFVKKTLSNPGAKEFIQAVSSGKEEDRGLVGDLHPVQQATLHLLCL